MFEKISFLHPKEWSESSLTVEDAIDEERRYYRRELKSNGVPFIPGSIELVSRLLTTGWRVGVASSAPMEQIRIVLEAAELTDTVACIRSGDDVKKGKPDPEIFLSTAAGLGVLPERCWVVEDSPNGVASAVSAGMKCIGFVYPSGAARTPKLPATPVVAASMSEVAAAIDPSLAVFLDSL